MYDNKQLLSVDDFAVRRTVGSKQKQQENNSDSVERMGNYDNSVSLWFNFSLDNGSFFMIIRETFTGK